MLNRCVGSALEEELAVVGVEEGLDLVEEISMFGKGRVSVDQFERHLAG